MHTASENAPRNTPNGVSESVTESDQNALTKPLENKGQTLWDETQRNAPNMNLELLQALTRALERATDDATVLEIVRELRALRAGK
jgi:hypothetical protein